MEPWPQPLDRHNAKFADEVSVEARGNCSAAVAKAQGGIDRSLLGWLKPQTTSHHSLWESRCSSLHKGISRARATFFSAQTSTNKIPWIFEYSVAVAGSSSLAKLLNNNMIRHSFQLKVMFNQPKRGIIVIDSSDNWQHRYTMVHSCLTNCECINFMQIWTSSVATTTVIPPMLATHPIFTCYIRVIVSSTALSTVAW